MVVNVRGQVHLITPSDNSLLAVTRGPPIDFEHQLIGLDRSRCIRKPLTHLGKEKDETLSASRIITQPVGSEHGRAAFDRPIDDLESLRRVPILCARRSCGSNGKKDRQYVSRYRSMWAAVMCLAWATACESVTDPRIVTLATAELLILGAQATAPSVATLSVYVVNSRPITVRLLHADQFNTQYVEVRFPTGSVESVNGLIVGPQDSVLVDIDARDSQYGMTISSGTLVFSAGNLPRATFTYAVYGDRSVADGSTTYASRDSYSAALDIWEQVSVDQWQQATNSSTPGSDEVSGSLTAGGLFVVAAPR